MQAADGTVDPTENPLQSFNPFLVEDPTPPLLLDSPTDTEIKPIVHVLSFFQKETFMETDSNVSENILDTKITNKAKVDEKLSDSNETEKTEKKSVPPPRPPPPILKTNNTDEHTNPSSENISSYKAQTSFNSSVYTANEELPVDSHISGK